MDFPSAGVETEVVAHETGIDQGTAKTLVTLGNAIRSLDSSALNEVASTRMLILAGGLVAEGLDLRDAVQSAVVEVLSDDLDVIRALGELVDAVRMGERRADRACDHWPHRGAVLRARRHTVVAVERHVDLGNSDAILGPRPAVYQFGVRGR
mgnify:CR=1 FL=1